LDIRVGERGDGASKKVLAPPERQSLSAHRAAKPQEDNHQDGKPQNDIVSACNAAVGELKASRRLIDLLESENSMLRERLETEKRTTALLTELNETRRAESDALRNAVAAKNETLLTKDAVIASQDKLIVTLKTKKSSPWKRLGDVLIGVAAGMVLR
jgi:hypothetical protein